MAFSAKWITASGTVNLSDGNPYKIDAGSGLGAAEVRNLYERGPQQNGVSDLGYRIDPRTVTLGIFLAGTSTSHLDGLRDTLQRAFSPRAGLGTLQITRDDGEIRELYARRSGPLDMPLVPSQRPGKLHKTAVQLFAPDPAWTEPAAGSVSFLTPSDWWLAFNSIGSANVLDHQELPAQGSAWAYAGTITAGNPWMIAIRSGRETAGAGTTHYAFDADPNLGGSNDEVRFSASGTPETYTFLNGQANSISGTSIMAAGTHNYFFVERGTATQLYRNGVLVAALDPEDSGGALSGTVRRWRSDASNTAASRWAETLPRVAIYNISPTAAQIAALNTAMESGGSVYNISMAYAGDLPEYPVIKITGPISDPVLTNTTTGETLDFTGYTIAAADFYTIDLRYGSKTVRNSGGDNKVGQLSNASDLASFHIEPAPVAAGGTNIFSLAGTATTGATGALITYYNRFESW